MVKWKDEWRDSRIVQTWWLNLVRYSNDLNYDKNHESISQYSFKCWVYSWSIRILEQVRSWTTINREQQRKYLVTLKFSDHSVIPWSLSIHFRACRAYRYANGDDVFVPWRRIPTRTLISLMLWLSTSVKHVAGKHTRSAGSANFRPFSWDEISSRSFFKSTFGFFAFSTWQ